MKGDRVMVQLPRVNEFWIQLFGLMRIGAVPCPGTTLLMAKGEPDRAGVSETLRDKKDRRGLDSFTRMPVGAYFELWPPESSDYTSNSHKSNAHIFILFTDLKYRAESSRAVAFVGDVESCTRFEEIAKEVGVDNIFQVRTDGDGGVGSGRQDFQALVEAVSEGSKWMGPPHKSNDLALLCELAAC